MIANMNDAILVMQMAILEIISNDHKFQLLALALILSIDRTFKLIYLHDANN